MPWIEVLAVLIVSHLVGDFVLQTEFQATQKGGGLGRSPVARRALLSHMAIYAVAFVPAFIWLAGEHDVPALAGLAALVLVPHTIQDDRRLLAAYARRVKHMDPAEQPVVMLLLDQSMHLVVLFGVALLAGT